MYVYTDGNCRGCSILHQAEPHALDSHDDTTTVLVIGDGIIFDPYYVQADNEKKGENFE